MNQDNLDRQMKQSHDRAQNCDDWYEDISDTEESFSEDGEDSDEEYYECLICDDRFGNQTDIVRVRHIKQSNLKIQCELCNDRFVSDGDLTEHVSKKHR